MELVIFVGLQASGKSTFFAQKFAATHHIVSKDLIPNHKNRAKRQAKLIEEALQAGISLVVDNTNPTIEERASIIELGKLYKADIVGYYFQSQVSFCLERNQQRVGTAKVPDVAIYATSRKLERPTFIEGFDKLFYVKITDNSEFEVCQWTEAELAQEW